MAVEGWHHISPHPPQLFSGRYVDGEPRRGWGGAFCFSGDLVAVENLGRETGANVTGMAVAGAEDYGGLPLSLPSFCQTAICGLGQPVQLVVGDGGGSTNLVMPPEIGHPSSLAIHRQSSELDRTRRMTVEIEGIVRGQTKEVVAAFQQQILRRLREKDEEMQRMEKLNLVLQERITALTAENQFLRGLAATSEAAVNSLRSNLEQVMAVAEVEEDAESCCWSGGGGSAAAAAAQEEQEEGSRRGRAACCCRGCGEEEEPSVVVLPCRHLCLCTQCGSKVRGCPVCGCVMTGTVHVNMW
ncbi:hypothetical protein SAY86_003307 [Trapa natans]|uniref:RING-type domain-containing protein n=1 Tax=Trapa natans TaxID=22666 RepID=A0AAN7MCH7_TRANT|nr:hypothetical protein SAY86_003307 [Trapa natans]